MDQNFANDLERIEKRLKRKITRLSKKDSKYYHSLGDALSKKIDRQRHQEKISKWFNG